MNAIGALDLKFNYFKFEINISVRISFALFSIPSIFSILLFCVNLLVHNIYLQRRFCTMKIST